MIQIGITSILTLICCIIMCTLACLIKSKPSDRGAIQNKHLVKTSRVRMYLSAINMGCMTTAVFIILLSYFTPKIFNYCCCRLMFILAIAFYVVGSYALKFCFLLHFHLVYIILNYKLNKVSKSYSIAPEGTDKFVRRRHSTNSVTGSDATITSADTESHTESDLDVGME
eukprot:180965_1